jgi:ribosomal protein L33
MAKKEKDLYCLKSKESPHRIYLFVKKRKTTKKQSTIIDPKKKEGSNDKLLLRKYDPVKRKHVLFSLEKPKK